METTKALVHQWAPFLVVGFLLVLKPGPGVRAQENVEACTSFILLAPDPGPELAYTFPVHYGTFADVEVGAVGDGTVQLEVTVFEKSAIKDRRIWVLVPGRVELLTEILDVDNLFEIGSPLLVRMTASGPLSAMLVRE
ncbi:MAG TPA: hypothetical protein VJH87_17125 [Vicinamibacteria bacterium]|nr:hypothetical protein [Vicinamibacteria bacterium]